MPAREGPENGRAEARPVFSISGGAFSDLRKGHRFCEDPKTHQVAHWRWRFFGSRAIKGKENYRGLRFERFPPSNGLTKRPKCLSAAAASSGLARAQDWPNVVRATRRQRAFTWVFGMPHSKACIDMRPPDHVTSAVAPDFVSFRCALIVGVPAYCPT